MTLNYGSDKKSAIQAKSDAQKLAFAPIMFQAAKSLRDLGILKSLRMNKQGLTISEVAEKTNLSEYGVKVLLEAGLSMEMVFVKDDKFFLSKTGWFILSDELTRINMDFTNDVNYLGMFSLLDSVKTGKPTGLQNFGNWNTIYEALPELPEKVKQSWFAFDHFYSNFAFSEILPYLFEDKPSTILDVGGNTGEFSIKCAEYNEHVKVTILDLPGQLNTAKENIRNRGFEDRISLVSTDLLDHSIPFPKNNDIIWMSQFLDCFSQEDIVELLLRARNAMDEGSSLFILETFWDKQKYEASTYSLHATSLYFTNIANGCSQMYYSEDLYKLIDKAGLAIVKSYEDIGVSHTLLKCKVK